MLITSLVRHNAHKLTILRSFFLELHRTLGFCEECVITTDADVRASMKPCAALTNKDIARNDLLAAIHLHAQSLGL